jgi:hypothetical protein
MCTASYCVGVQCRKLAPLETGTVHRHFCNDRNSAAAAAEIVQSRRRSIVA